MTFEDYGITGLDLHSHEEQRVICPKCSSERRKSYEKCLAVNVEKEVWFCWHCLWSGGLKEEKPHQYIVKEVVNKTKPPSSAIYGYFSKRGIDSDIVDYNRIREDALTFHRGEDRKWAIAFPYYLGDKLINIKYRSLDKDFLQSSGVTHKTFYNLNNAIWQDSIIITEGEIDCLSFQQAGYMNVVSVPDGAPNPDAKEMSQKFSFLDNSIEFLQHINKYYLACDKDPNGNKLRDELARRLGKAKCLVVDYPSDCKDANDVLMKHGADRLRRCIIDAMPYPVEGVFKVVDVKDEISHIYKYGHPQGTKTGWRTLNELFTIHPGMLSVITGIPNHGKSPFLDNLCLNVAENYGTKIGFFSPENGSVANHIIRLIRQRTRNQFFPGYHERVTEREVNDAEEFINEHFHFVMPDNESYTVDKILDRFSYLVAKYGINIVGLDPYNTLEHLRASNQSETEYIGKLLNRFKYFAREHNVHFFQVAHPAKMIKQKDSPLYEVPNLYSISGSANWNNVPDNGITVYRQFSRDMSTTEYTAIYVQKVKFDWVGRPGVIKLHFDVASQRFEEDK